VDAAPAVPYLSPAIDAARCKNFLTLSLRRPVIAALDYLHRSDAIANVEQIASVGLRHGAILPIFAAASHASRLIVCTVDNDLMKNYSGSLL